MPRTTNVAAESEPSLPSPAAEADRQPGPEEQPTSRGLLRPVDPGAAPLLEPQPGVRASDVEAEPRGDGHEDADPAADLHAVAGCPFTIPGPKPQPCVTIRWAPAARVFINGQPAVVQVPGPGQGICQSAEQIPQGPPVVAAVQTRVVGS